MDEKFKRILTFTGVLIITSAFTVFIMAMNTNGKIREFEALRERCTEIATGTVTDVHEEWYLTGGKFRTKNYVYRTEYTFTVGDKKIESVFISREDTRSKLRDHINVYYDPDEPHTNYTSYDEPEKDRIDVAESCVLSVLMTAAGALLICWPLGVFTRFRRREEFYFPAEEEIIDEDEENSI